MNLKEGTRRLALLLGVAGAILGGFASYSELQSTLEQRAEYAEFERLAKSEVVQQARTSCLSDNPPPGFGKLVSQPPVNDYGITGINWTQDCRADMIYTGTGGIPGVDVFYPELGPRAWEHVLIAILPLLGFFLPWGAVRAIGWVGAGFIQSSK